MTGSMVDKPLSGGIASLLPPGTVDVPLDPASGMDGAGVTMLPDGGAEIDLDAAQGLLDADRVAAETQHDFNLALVLTEAELGQISSDLTRLVAEDDASRQDWLETTRAGIEKLGLKPDQVDADDDAFVGITTLRHPLMANAVIRAWSTARAELLPAKGPVRSEVVGEVTPAVLEQAKRVETYLNYWATEQAPEFYPDDSKMLFYVFLGGCAFKKSYRDATLGRVTSRFCLPDSVIVSYTASDLASAPRVTHEVTLSALQMAQSRVAGVYRDTTLMAVTDQPGVVREAADAVQGVSPGQEDVYVVQEIHTELDLPGFVADVPLPYIVSIDKGSGKVLAIRRNWDPADPLRRREPAFTKYGFITGPGFYDLGYVHLIGGMADAVTAQLRTMLDAGLFANFPAGFKAKSLRLQDNQPRLRPGEFIDVDVPPDMLDRAIKPLPFRGPDATSFALYQGLVQEGERLASTAMAPTGDLNPYSPATTTLALLDEQAKVMSAALRDMHVSRRDEFRILCRLFARTLPAQYPFAVRGGSAVIAAADFDGRVDVLPTAEAAAASKSQRLALAQAKLQTLAQAQQIAGQLMQSGQPVPFMVNWREGFSDVFAAMEVFDVDRLMPAPPAPPPPMSADPLAENAALAAGMRVQPVPGQDHVGHLEVHFAFLSVPGMVATPAGQQMVNHVFQTLALAARDLVQAQIGMLLPPPGQPLHPQLDRILAQVGVQYATPYMQRLAQLLVPPDASAAQTQALKEIEAVKASASVQREQIKSASDERLRSAEMRLQAQRDEHQRAVDWVELELKAVEIESRIAPPAAAVNVQELLAGIEEATGGP
jgi:hypothetical protein